MRAPIIRANFEDELVIDNFACGGGATIGIENAIGRPVDVAINHDADAIAVHKKNHPHTLHYTNDLWHVDPHEVCKGRPVGFLWFSPDCTHHSRASGTAKKRDESRGLANIIPGWLRATNARVCAIENVPEFRDWGPLDSNDQAIKEQRGDYYALWLAEMRACGYTLEWRDLRAMDFGAPTTRKRWFLIARRDDRRITWPRATHGPGLKPYATAADCINWEHPTRSIFGRKLKNGSPKSLAEPTLARIAKGIEKFVINTASPFIVRTGHYSHKTGAGIIAGRGAGLFRGQSLQLPLGTVCGTNDKNLVLAYVAKHNGGDIGAIGQPLIDPLHTVTATDSKALVTAHLMDPGVPNNSEQVAAFLMKYNRTGCGSSLHNPMPTVTGKHRFALVQVHGVPHRIVDIQMRMLQPDELFKAQGFPDHYHYHHDHYGRPLTQAFQTYLAGNAVVPVCAEVITAEAGRI